MLLALMLTEIVLALLFGVGERTGLVPSIRDMRWTVISIPFFWRIAPISLALTKRRSRRPTAALLKILRRERHWLIRAVGLTMLLVPFSGAITLLKHAIPVHVAFYADPYLAQLDRMIFGTDPWRLTHAALGLAGTLVLDRIYLLWFFVMFGMTAWLAFSRDLRFQLHGFIAFSLTWIILGNIFALAFSSAGPWAYARYFGVRDFDPLMQQLAVHSSVAQVKALAIMAYLEKPGIRLGSGISAMPSLHVAIAFLFFLACRSRIKQRWASWSAALFVGLIWLGSVHLGWHYATDGFVSIVGVAGIWWLSGKIVEGLWPSAEIAGSEVGHKGPGFLIRPRKPVVAHGLDAR